MTVETSALVPVSEAVTAILNDPALHALGVTVWEQVPADWKFPSVVYFVSETQFRSFSQGGKAIELRIHLLTQDEGLRRAYQIHEAMVDLLGAATDGTMAMDGFQFQWADYLGMLPLPDEYINGKVTQHLQARWMLVVTES